MAHFDVFNGDADGLCALQQLRLAQPRAGKLITGVKRDIALLKRVPAQAGDTVTVLDVSLERNRAALLALLDRGVAVEYFDHHHAGRPLVHPGLRLHLDTGPQACTSLLVDAHLGGRFRDWTIVGAFGDDLGDQASRLSAQQGLDEAATAALRRLGEALNYHAYGDSEADLLMPAAKVHERMRRHAQPLDLVAADSLAQELEARERDDMAWAARSARPMQAQGAWLLPDEPAARRVLGSWANALSRAEPHQAHVVLRPAGDCYVASVRAPRNAPCGADALCRVFGGNGRTASAGVDRLPADRLADFLLAFGRAFDAPQHQEAAGRQ